MAFSKPEGSEYFSPQVPSCVPGIQEHGEFSTVTTKLAVKAPFNKRVQHMVYLNIKENVL